MGKPELASGNREEGDAVAAVPGINRRLGFGGEDVAGVHHARTAEHDDGVAVGVRRAKVIQINRFPALEQGQLVLDEITSDSTLADIAKMTTAKYTVNPQFKVREVQEHA